jgi:deoxycytidylate deaminase
MARKSPSRVRMGAVVAKRGRAISTGFNQMRKTHPMMARYHEGDHNIGLHAEVHACIGVDAEDLVGATLYVTRIYKSGKQAMAKPCNVCRRFLASVGIDDIAYTQEDGQWV